MPENILIAIAWPYANAEIHVGNITVSHLPGDIVAVVAIVPSLVEVALLEIREQLDPQIGAPGRYAGHIDGQARPSGKPAGGVVGVVRRQSNLLEVVLATHAAGGLADLLHRGQEQSNEDRDNGDDHQQLDQ